MLSIISCDINESIVIGNIARITALAVRENAVRLGVQQIKETAQEPKVTLL